MPILSFLLHTCVCRAERVPNYRAREQQTQATARAVTFLPWLPADAARRARPGKRRGGKVTEHDLRLVLRLAKRAGALEVRVSGMTIMFARDAGKRG